jgi:zinc/manganese transport system permease protein
MRLTARPLRALWISAGIAVASVWIGLAVSYTVPQVPPSFGILAVATLAYVGSVAVSSRRRWAAA